MHNILWRSAKRRGHNRWSGVPITDRLYRNKWRGATLELQQSVSIYRKPRTWSMRTADGRRSPRADSPAGAHRRRNQRLALSISSSTPSSQVPPKKYPSPTLVTRSHKSHQVPQKSPSPTLVTKSHLSHQVPPKSHLSPQVPPKSWSPTKILKSHQSSQVPRPQYGHLFAYSIAAERRKNANSSRTRARHLCRENGLNGKP